MRRRGRLAKLIAGEDTKGQNLVTWFGALYQRSPEACEVAFNLLLIFDDLNHIRERESRPEENSVADLLTESRSETNTVNALDEAEIRDTILEAGLTLLLLCEKVFRKRNGEFLHVLGDALQGLADGPVDEVRAQLLVWKRELGATEIPASTFEEAIARMGIKTDNRILRRLLTELGLRWKKGKPGRPKAS